MSTAIRNSAVPTPHRSHRHSRTLYPPWFDRATGVHQIVQRNLREEIRGVDARFYTENSSNLVQQRKQAFEDSERVLRDRDIDYDPRDSRAQVPFGEAGMFAREARRNWVLLKDIQREDEEWNKLMEGVAEQRLAILNERFTAAEQAYDLHIGFLLAVRKHALRWRIVGRTVLGSVRWMRRAFGTERLMRSLRRTPRLPALGSAAAFGVRWIRKVRNVLGKKSKAR